MHIPLFFLSFSPLMYTLNHLSCLCSLQVSAEPDGSSYVFQGFIQGKDYGQFGLQRLGNFLLGLVTALNNCCWVSLYNKGS